MDAAGLATDAERMHTRCIYGASRCVALSFGVAKYAIPMQFNAQGGRMMMKDDAVARLRALATDDKRRSETARLREIFDEVEATLNAGATQADVLAELHASGFTMTMASFKSALQRIRKARTAPITRSRSSALPAKLTPSSRPRTRLSPWMPTTRPKAD